MSRLAAALLVGLWLGVPPQAPLAVRDLDGRAWNPLNPAASDVNLVIFISATCPISQRYSPEIDRILHDYGAKGVHAWLVYTDPKIDAATVRANLKEFHPSVTVPVIIDTGFRLTAAVDAKVTPEVAIYTRSGRVYRGRIDDANEAIGQNRRTVAHHDLRDALDAVLAGRPVANPDTKAIGCFIERDVK
ncbi:MAG TPA: hypothetical protein VLT86_17395 [Vicinamibacterales bacterium]|nr:hypothetical protein [Vicinamibacterales bacterium]